MPRLSKKRTLKRKGNKKRQRGSGYGKLSASPASKFNTQRGGRKLSKKRALSRRNSKSLKRESFLSTLNQMGGFIRDGSTQFFKVLEQANRK
jgi:hypothetical protein